MIVVGVVVVVNAASSLVQINHAASTPNGNAGDKNTLSSEQAEISDDLSPACFLHIHRSVQKLWCEM